MYVLWCFIIKSVILVRKQSIETLWERGDVVKSDS